MLDMLCPVPRQVTALTGEFPKPCRVKIAASTCPDVSQTARMLRDDLEEICAIPVTESADYTLTLDISPGTLPREGYLLEVKQDGALLRAEDAPGLFYAAQTLLQILALSDSATLPCVSIRDWPHYKTRSVMVDIGRAPFTRELLRRVIRILARLKLNSLHLHLFDDHLNGVRFDSLPLGSENPLALSIAEYGEIIRYARRHHISVVPEFECWGHAGSILYHYPKLYGAPGMWEGFSFGIGEELYQLLERMLDEFVPVVETESVFHVGLDEANWALLPSVKPEQAHNYSPMLHVQRLHEILMRVGEKHGKRLRMRLWADHGGRPLPGHLREEVIIEPWMYFEGREDDIRKKVATYSGEGKTPFMMGGGMSSLHFDGHYGATRLWCQEARNALNCEGINMCIWETNDIAGHLIGVYGGSIYAWNPEQPPVPPEDRHSERQRGLWHKAMRKWQVRFRDADPNAINADRGPEVNDGHYVWPPLAAIPVAPTARLIDPRTVDAFNESETVKA